MSLCKEKSGFVDMKAWNGLFLVFLPFVSFVIHRFIPFAAHLASLFSLQQDLSGTSEREEIIRGERDKGQSRDN